MLADRTYEVRWLMIPDEPDGEGLYGTTTHSANSPESAVLTSAESVACAIANENYGTAFHVISVTGVGSELNLLSADQLQLALRYYPRELPLDVVYRPLC